MGGYLGKGCDGILGWDFLSFVADRRITFDLKQRSLVIDGPSPRFAGFGSSRRVAKLDLRQIGGSRLPCVDLDCFGSSSCVGAMGIVDTGSLITIVSTALSEEAGLFPSDEDDLI